MPRVWLAIFFGYSAKNFYRLQYQSQDLKTVESQIILTLFKGGLLETRNYTDAVKVYKWSRAATTNKGTHAVCNGISCLFFINDRFFDEDKNLKKNELLIYLKEIFQSTQIMFYSFKTVTAKFDLRKTVKCRTYHYICPWAFFQETDGAKNQTSQGILDRIHQCCRLLTGSHNFHNYSNEVKARESKARRYVIDFRCEKVDNMARFIIKGESFIFHQIRKMVGIIIQTFIHNYSPSYIGNTLYSNRVKILLAPPYGLYLRRLSFDSYNKKQDVPEKLEFEDEEPTMKDYEDKIQTQIHAYGIDIWKKWYNEVKERRPFKFDEDEQGQDDD